MTLLFRLSAVTLVAVTLAGCAELANLPATIPSTNVNPITGSRGGSGSAN